MIIDEPTITQCPIEREKAVKKLFKGLKKRIKRDAPIIDITSRFCEEFEAQIGGVIKKSFVNEEGVRVIEEFDLRHISIKP